MNNWLKIALYSLAGVIMGSVIIGMMVPGNVSVNNMGYNGYQNGGYPTQYTASYQAPQGTCSSNMQGGRGMGMMGMMGR